MQHETAMGKSTEARAQKPRASGLSIAFSIAGLVMGLACWTGLAVLARYATDEARAMLGWWMLFFGSSFAVLVGLVFSVVAYVPRGRVWPLATLSLLVNLTFPCFFGGSAVGLQEGLLAVGYVCVVVGAVVGTVLLLRRMARRRGWSRRARAMALIIGLCVVGLLSFAMFVLLVG